MSCLVPSCRSWTTKGRQWRTRSTPCKPGGTPSEHASKGKLHNSFIPGKSRAVWYSLDLTKAVIHPLSPKSVVWFSLCKAYNSALEIEAHLPPQLILYQLYSLSSILYDQLEQLENPIWCWCCRCHWLSSLWSLTVVCKNCQIKKQDKSFLW